MMNRRNLMQSLVASPFILGLASRASAQAQVDLVIIGAGAAGLAGAHSARAKGLSVQVFEARSRVGGRVFTDSSLGSAYDAGAFYIHFSQRNPWREITQNLAVPMVEDAQLIGGYEMFRDGKPIPIEERVRRRGSFSRLSDVLDGEGGVDLSFAEAARRISDDAIGAAQSTALLALGEEAERVSVKDYQRLDSGEDLVIPSGYGALLTRYAQGLDVALATPVTAVDYSGAGVRVETSRGAVMARAVLITVPISLLQAEKLRFSPALPLETLTALDGLQMGALTKVALKFEGTRFGLTPWTQFYDQGSGGGDLINFEFWPFDRDLVIAMFGGDYARSLAKAGEREAVRIILARLETLLGERVVQTFRAGRLAGWSADPFSLGSYSIARPGYAQAREALAHPVAGRVYFAGEANAGAASMTAGGAALAAIRAVDLIAGSL